MNHVNPGNHGRGNLINTNNLKALRDEYETYRQKRLLHTLNTVTNILLSESDDNKFDISLLESMALLARCVDVDRINIWRNEVRDGVLHYIMQYGWFNDLGRKWAHFQPGDAFPYGSAEIEYARDKYGNDSRGLKSCDFLKGKYINGSLSSLSGEQREAAERYGIKSILIIPVFLRGSFWGLVTFDDCHKERAFTEDEISVMRSVSHMFANALRRDNVTDTTRLEPAHGKAQLAYSANSDFLARMSYEMRAPLDAIIGLSELAFENDELNAESLAGIEQILNAGMTLIGTVNDLLDISIDAEKLEFAPFENQQDFEPRMDANAIVTSGQWSSG
jgi:hypothetical protein